MPADTDWNVWTEAVGTRTSDHRYGLDNHGSQSSLNIGVDRAITKDVVAGLSFGPQTADGRGYRGMVRTDLDGFSIGPYAAARLSDNWAATASLSYTHASSDLTIDTLSGQSTLKGYAGSLGLSGQYLVGDWYLRPKLSLTYSSYDSEANTLHGTIGGAPASLYMDGSRTHLGVAEASIEFSRMYALDNGSYLIPYLELGISNEFNRSNGGRILTGDLTYATPSPWYGSVRAGARMQLSNNVLLEGSLGYLSLGQDNRNVVEGRLRMAIGF